MKADRTKRAIFIFFFMVLCLPVLQTNLQVIDSGRLGGYQAGNPNVLFTLKDWWDGSYQEGKTKYLNDSFGFRQDFVRLNNEIDYKAFSLLHAGGTVLGKDDYLFQNNYIEAYYGKGYVGDSTTRISLRKLKRIQDTLETLGKKMVFVMAPSKAEYLPENLPDGPATDDNVPTYYKSYTRLCDSLGIHTFNVNAWFSSGKGKWEYPVFTRQGTHWSIYGGIRAADSLIRYLNRTGGMHLPEMVFTGVEKTDKLRFTDGDIASAINLIKPAARDVAGYLQYHFKQDSTARKPRIVFLGDSFIWTWVDGGINENISSYWEYWYYFNELYDQQRLPGYGPVVTIGGGYDWATALNKADCFIIVYTEPNFQSFADTFIDKAYDHFYPSSSNKK